MSLLNCLGVLVLVLASLCGAVLAQGDTKADIRGTVTRVTPAAAGAKDALGSVLVEGKKEKTTQYDRASIRITAKTKIEKLVGQERKPARFEDLRPGTKVQAVFTGPVAESYPVQAAAGAILILEEAKDSKKDSK